MAQRRFPYERVGGEPADEREHFIQCPDCSEWIDMRDLGAVLAHEETCAQPGSRTSAARSTLT